MPIKLRILNHNPKEKWEHIFEGLVTPQKESIIYTIPIYGIITNPQQECFM